MPKSDRHIDVLVFGEHPSAYLVAAMLRHKTKYRIVHSTIPNEQTPDRLVIINPALFELHALLEPLRRKIETRAVYGLQFLADDPATHSEYRNKSTVTCVGPYKDIRKAMQSLAEQQGVEFVTPRQIQIHRVEEHGIEVSLGNQTVHPKALVLAGRLADAQERILGVPKEWERGVLHRYSYVKLRGTRLADLSGRPLMPMSLDLRGLLSWAWLLPGPHHVQLAIEQPLEQIQQIKPVELLQHWANVLHHHGIFQSPLEIHPNSIESLDLPLAGALAQEDLANRTLLIGPAGGFYSATTEDIYPNCWSALYAADVLKKALKELHLQDALQLFRHRWRTTLGDYLRGPQQNLRFLLPLVYRNQIMSHRMGEAILTGASVVR
jgi:flavin-dependent dehydrogenase